MRVDQSEQIVMASFTSNGDFAPGLIFHSAIDVAAPGQAFRFGSLDFITDNLGNLHLTVPMCRSPITRSGETESESDSSLMSADQQDLSLVGFVDSLFPAIDEAPGSDQESDQAESMGSFAPPLEVFMAEEGEDIPALEAPIADQTPQQSQRQPADRQKQAPHGGMSCEEVLDLPCHLHGAGSEHSTRECRKLRSLIQEDACSSGRRTQRRLQPLLFLRRIKSS